MVKDAEAHAEEDKRFHELVGVRNQADNLIHSVEKTLSDMGEQVEADEKSSIESALGELREAMKGDNKEDIEAKTQKLTEVSGKLAERMYAQQAGQGGAEGATGGAGEPSGGQGQQSAQDDVVDAEFEEVDDKKK
jgi:molecular chaperone DnaK